MPKNSLSLYEIESTLQELLDIRADAEERGALPEEFEAIDKAEREYLALQMRKVDGIARAVLALTAAADAVDQQIEKLRERSKAHHANAQRIKNNVLAVMQSQTAPCPECRGEVACRRCDSTRRIPSPISKLETPAHYLRVQGNGGVELVDIASWPKTESGAYRALPKPPDGVPAKATYLPDTDAIRGALKRGEDIPGAKLLERGQHLRVG